MISYHHDITGRHGISRFLSKVHQKHKVYYFFPFIKARNEKINELQAITFYDKRASDAQTRLAPPKRQFLEKQIPPRKIEKTNCQNNFFRCRKMKRWE